MKQILTVIGFEYNGYVRSKAFRITTLIFVGLIFILAFLPQIGDAISKSDIGKGQEKSAVVLLGDNAAGSEISKAAFSEEALKKSFKDINWIDGNKKGYTDADLREKIKNGKIAYAIYYDGGTDYSFYASGSNLTATAMVPMLDAYVTQVAKMEAVSSLPEDEQKPVMEIASMTANAKIVEVGGNAENNFWLGYVLMLFLFYMIVAYGNMVSSAVVTEKTSKAMELLITAAKPVSLMSGKVVGVGLAALTQAAAFITAVVIGLLINLNQWKAFQPDIFDVLSSANISYEIIIVLVLNFFLGFFIYAFILAALASTVSRPEEASTVTLIPTLLMVGSMVLGFLSLSGVLSKSVAAVLSYIPPFTPFVLTARFCTNDVSAAGLVLGILALAAGVVLCAWIAAKIYRIGVMMYGASGGLKQVLKAIRQ